MYCGYGLGEEACRCGVVWVARALSRTISYNLCNRHHEYEDVFDANLDFFERICVHWYSFFQHEIGVILNQVILPQLMEHVTPMSRRLKLLQFVERVVCCAR